MVAHAYDTINWESEAGVWIWDQPQVLSEILSLKTKTCRAVVSHAFNPSAWEAEVGRFLSLKPVCLHSEFQDSQSDIVRPCFEKDFFKVPANQDWRPEFTPQNLHERRDLTGVGWSQTSTEVSQPLFTSTTLHSPHSQSVRQSIVSLV